MRYTTHHHTTFAAHRMPRGLFRTLLPFGLLAGVVLSPADGMAQTSSNAANSSAAVSGAESGEQARVKALETQLESTRKQLESMEQQLKQLKSPSSTGETSGNAAPESRSGETTTTVGPLKINIKTEVEPSGPPGSSESAVEGARIPPIPEIPPLPAIPAIPPMPTIPPMPGLPSEVREGLQEALTEINAGLQEAQAEAMKAAEEARSEAMKAALEVREESLRSVQEQRDELLREVKDLARQLGSASEEERPHIERELARMERQLRNIDRELERADRHFEREARRIVRIEHRDSSDGEGRVSVGEGEIVKVDETVKDLVVVKGDGEVFGTVDGDAVVMAGDLIIHKGGRVRGDAVVFGGEIQVEEGGILDGEKVRGNFGMHHSESDDDEEHHSSLGLGDRFTNGLILWLLLMAAGLASMTFMPTRVKRMTERFEANPVGAAMAGGLTLLALIPLSVVLAITIVGILLVPVVWLMAFAAAIVGLVSAAQGLAKKIPLKGGPKTAAGLLAWGLFLFVVGTLPPGLGLIIAFIGGIVGLGTAAMTRLGNPEFEG